MPLQRKLSEPCQSGACSRRRSSVRCGGASRLNMVACSYVTISGLLHGSFLGGSTMLPVALAQSQHLRKVRNAHTYFCGPSWSELSTNCHGQQRCTSDDDCTTPGHFCYGDIDCDDNNESDAAHQAASQQQQLPPVDLANTRFCQSKYAAIDRDQAHCSIHLFCGDDTPCPENMACHYSQCNIHDLMEAERIRKEEEAAARSNVSREQELATLDPDDPIRFNSCGKTWTDADNKCGVWCWSESSECPDGEGCFADTSCYNSAGL